MAAWIFSLPRELSTCREVTRDRFYRSDNKIRHGGLVLSSWDAASASTRLRNSFVNSSMVRVRIDCDNSAAAAQDSKDALLSRPGCDNVCRRRTLPVDAPRLKTLFGLKIRGRRPEENNFRVSEPQISYRGKRIRSGRAGSLRRAAVPAQTPRREHVLLSFSNTN
ncbi:hypothetical protein EVAR_3984_1 [Eumeta japonica]|uniref:Uncharacterized protein n=1 Tax=Eumeta variegata TaxID=151549 RepID=A0A4C1SUD3_EUMVA|nr:hypothetical protein EVAR_3984_1 [Eumeta japonica]